MKPTAEKPFTAPNHLWTAGTAEPALAAAAWAGWYASKGDVASAARWEQIALERIGRVKLRMSGSNTAIEVREIGDEPPTELDTEEFCETMNRWIAAQFRRLNRRRPKPTAPMIGEGI